MPRPPSAPLEDYNAVLLGAGIDAKRYRTYAERLFCGVPLEGRAVLDVGGGSGFISFWTALQGARTTCLEPTAEGANPSMAPSFRRLEMALPAADVTLDPRPLQALPPEEDYDVVLVHNAINHLDEDACVALPDDEGGRLAYEEIFRRLRGITRPGGHLIVADCARRNLFGDLRLPNPFVPEIEWHLHQPPSTWRSFGLRAGFESPEIRWNAMTRAGRVGDMLLANWVGAYLTQSHFTLHLEAPAG